MAQVMTKEGLSVGLFIDEPTEVKPETKATKPLNRMNTAELEAIAEKKKIDISGCKTNRERIAKLS
jgi:hypothetical protein